MNQILYENRCKCNEEVSVAKKRRPLTRSRGKPLQYPMTNEVTSKTFQIKYEKNLSLIAKFVLNSFHNKYIYYAMDDILYLLDLNSTDKEDLLSILYSPIISLQNNLSVNFFDIWIREIYIEEIPKINRFIGKNFQTSEQFNFITIKLFYKTKVPVKKQESLW
jgi:hypothetical protein